MSREDFKLLVSATRKYLKSENDLEGLFRGINIQFLKDYSCSVMSYLESKFPNIEFNDNIRNDIYNIDRNIDEIFDILQG